MSNIASKNLYDLLGNDPDQDPELRQPEPPTKAIEKPTARTGKRNAPAEAPTSGDRSGARGGYRGTRNANENAFRDPGVGHDQNRSRGSGEPGVDGVRPGGRGRGRGGRARGDRRIGAAGGDRHSRSGIAEHEKQAAHGWGGQTGGDEWADEKAGEAIATEEQKEEGFTPAADENAGDGAADGAEPEPEDKQKSFAAYLAEQAEKKLALAATSVRQANEGSNQKFPEGKPISRDDSEDFIPGTGGKAKRERQRKEKAVVELDDARLHSAPRETRGGRGGRGGRGEFRGEGRGRGGGRGRGEGRGEGRGRGGRGQSGPNLNDSSAFPSLGAA